MSFRCRYATIHVLCRRSRRGAKRRLQHNAAGRHLLKRIPHGAWRIATAQMSHQATHRKRQSHVSRLPSHVCQLKCRTKPPTANGSLTSHVCRLMLVSSNIAPSRPPQTAVSRLTSAVSRLSAQMSRQAARRKYRNSPYFTSCKSVKIIGRRLVLSKKYFPSESRICVLITFHSMALPSMQRSKT